MAYLVFTTNGEEFDRRELTGPTVIGRAPDCSISVHDILLSRHHCKIEPSTTHGQQTWTLVDLHSKNGTQLRGTKIAKHVLHEGDELRIGRTRMTFMAGKFVGGKAVRKRAVVRAQDPKEALAGTVTGMVVCEPGESGVFPGLPTPKPRPADPSSYVRDDVYGMINQIISSSWDSVMEANSQPIRMQRARPIPMPGVTKASHDAAKPKPRVSFALQAEDRRAVEEIVVVSPRQRKTVRKRRWMYASASVMLLVIGFVIWQVVAKLGSVNAAPPPPAAVQTIKVDESAAQVASDEGEEVEITFECEDVED